MMDLQAYLERKLRGILSAWEEDDIYAISFLVYANEAYRYRGYSNVTEFSVSYNTEKDCPGAGALSEERWNYAFWRQEEVPVVAADGEGMDVLFDWYQENGISNIGYENPKTCYDEKMHYIGKGPGGYWELLWEIAAVARKLQDSGFIPRQFGRPIPILIHDLEYSWYTLEATEKANPRQEADLFFAAMKRLGIMQ